MRKAHEGLPYKDFARPATGVVQATVCSVSGKLPTEECGNHKISLWFLSGTQPTEHCEYHSSTSAPRTLAVSRLEQELFGAGFASDLLITDDAPLSFNLDDEDTEQNSGNSAFDFDSAESIDRNFLLD